MRKFLLIALFPLLLFIVGCEATVNLKGDRDAVNAEVYIDGERAGRMVLGKELAFAIISVKRGERELKVVSPSGKVLTKTINVNGDKYIAVVFADMFINVDFE